MSGHWTKCYRCDVGIWLSDAQYDSLIRSHAQFYCVWGHGQHFTGDQGELARVIQERDRLKQDAARMQDELTGAWKAEEQQRKRAVRNLHSAQAYKGVATKIKKRVAAGVCPCCNRSFAMLAAHMKSQHPRYIKEPLVAPNLDEEALN